MVTFHARPIHGCEMRRPTPDDSRRAGGNSWELFAAFCCRYWHCCSPPPSPGPRSSSCRSSSASRSPAARRSARSGRTSRSPPIARFAIDPKDARNRGHRRSRSGAAQRRRQGRVRGRRRHPHAEEIRRRATARSSTTSTIAATSSPSACSIARLAVRARRQEPSRRRVPHAQGYTVVWSGWIGELLPGDGRLLLQPPQARENGQAGHAASSARR